MKNSRMSQRKFDVNKYNEYVQDFIYKSIKNNKHIPVDKLRFENLPDGRWFIKYCPDKSVKTWKNFVTWTGLFTSETSKEKAAEMIYNYSNLLGRQLYYDDFRGTNPLIPSLSYINKIWGSMNKMKYELGLPIVLEDMKSKHLSKNDFDDTMNYIFNLAAQNKLIFITYSFIKSIDNIPSISCIEKACKKYYNKTLSTFITDNGFQAGKIGMGILFTFDDGETTTSQFEYLFSLYLRQFGLVYNKDYFRNIKYADFTVSYTGNMNCDYVIYQSDRVIYIEIPGIIEAYKDYYYKDKPIEKRSSREKYRLKLKEKEKLLQTNNLEYYFLFPCDLTKHNIDLILYQPSDNLRHEIEEFRKNNIDWQSVLTNGELKYSEEIKYGRNMIIKE